MADEEQTITLTESWGEEKFSPVPYNTVAVGPFFASVTLPLPQKPEAVDGARRRLAEKLRAHAEAERERKVASFLAMLKRMGLLS